MKINTLSCVFSHCLTLGALLAVIGMSTSCMTTYDARGNPVQSVDPGVAIAGVAAAGVVGYAIANDNRGSRYHHHHYRRSGGYYSRGYAYNPRYRRY
jgi:hypothetical protein